jgi:hypothetical protein
MANIIEFKPSNVHQGHYVYVNGESTDILVNLSAYNRITDYQESVDKKIQQFINNQEEEQ